ncbi:MAG TPA: protein translocase subunit SecD, partial [candidate division WOR-3 bacterium]|nr:protein translocase subunit SecD [candidate division WOR-3 bacterium]
ARRCVDKYNLPAVCFQLNAEGARKFEKVTSQNVGRQLAIVLDNVIESAPSIRSTIFDSGIIEGSFTGEEAHDLALILRTGSLPASIKIIEERTIGPSLGADSIRKGLKASALALVLVMLFMILYYNLAGVNATIALIMNMIIIFGALSLFRAALTLPGIAGIVLTIGMSVDANVLIFERIREELRNGKSPIAAIDAGFARAFTTILDANLTTIIAAIFLFSFGTGPIKGFAVTLIIGIIASIFTAVFVSKTIFELLYFGKRKVEKISI